MQNLQCGHRHHAGPSARATHTASVGVRSAHLRASAPKIFRLQPCHRVCLRRAANMTSTGPHIHTRASAYAPGCGGRTACQTLDKPVRQLCVHSTSGRDNLDRWRRWNARSGDEARLRTSAMTQSSSATSSEPTPDTPSHSLDTAGIQLGPKTHASRSPGTR